MKTIKDYIDKEFGKTALIVGAGPSVKDHFDSISKFVKKNNPVIFGINNMVDFFVPDYHVWTNNQRFRTFGHKIDKKSTVLLGSNISIKNVNKIIGDREYVVLNRIDRPGVGIKYENGTIYGYFRTCGNLSIMLAHLMGIEDINIVGFDGYTFYDKASIESGNKPQHCYGTGNTDNTSWDAGAEKDKIISGVLDNIKAYGVNFKIITPTKYEAHYDSTRCNT